MEAMWDFGCWPGLFTEEEAEDLHDVQRKIAHGDEAKPQAFPKNPLAWSR